MKKLIAILLGLALPCLSLLAADLYAHHKFDQFGGLNRQGIRGPIVGSKYNYFDNASGTEYRIVVLGGSTAFGAGVRYWESWPAQLEGLLRQVRTENDPHWIVGRNDIRVINLGYNSEGSYAMRPTLEDFAWLKPDLVILYEGYNDLGGFNTNLYRHESFLFRHFGYLPILDLIIREKIMSLRSGGYLDAAYRGQKTVFHMTRMQAMTASGLSVAQATMKALDNQLNGGHVGSSHMDIAEPGQIAWYLENIDRAIDWCISLNDSRASVPVLVVGQPSVSAMHIAQQTALKNHLQHSYSAYIDLGQLIDLHDTSLVLDGMHLNTAGNRKIAEALVDPVLAQWDRTH